MNKKPRIAIVTPYKNAACFIETFVQMLQRQTYSDWTCYFVDDASQDSSRSLALNATKNDIRFHHLYLQPTDACFLGPSRPRNHALHHVIEPIVCFCDIDDLWHPEKIQKQLKFHTQNNLDLSCTAYGRFKNSMDSKLSSIRVPPSICTFKTLLQGNFIPLSSVMSKTHILRAGFPDRPHEDYACWLRILKHYSDLKYGCLTELVTFYRIHQGNISSKKLKTFFWTSSLLRLYSRGPVHHLFNLSIWLLNQAKIYIFYILSHKSTLRHSLTVSSLMETRPLRLQ